MDAVGSVWAYGLLVGIIFGTIGMMFGQCLGFRSAGIILSGMGVALALMLSMFFGAMVMLHALDGATTATVHDGRTDIIINLKLGPFSYSRTIDNK